MKDIKSVGLILTHKWYDMIASGVKKEEYREIKKYYLKLLCEKYTTVIDGTTVYDFKHFDAVRFHRGYTKTSMLVELKSIHVGQGNPDWGAPNYPVFIIELGKVIEKS